MRTISVGLIHSSTSGVLNFPYDWWCPVIRLISVDLRCSLFLSLAQTPEGERSRQLGKTNGRVESRCHGWRTLPVTLGLPVGSCLIGWAPWLYLLSCESIPVTPHRLGKVAFRKRFRIRNQRPHPKFEMNCTDIAQF